MGGAFTVEQMLLLGLNQEYFLDNIKKCNDILRAQGKQCIVRSRCGLGVEGSCRLSLGDWSAARLRCSVGRGDSFLFALLNMRTLN